MHGRRHSTVGPRIAPILWMERRGGRQAHATKAGAGVFNVDFPTIAVAE